LISTFKAKRWEEYRDFFQLWYVRYFIGWFSLVPLLHRILRGLPDKIQISNDWAGVVPGVTFSPQAPLVLNFSLPFTWQLLWIASFLFFVAFLIYHLKCPPFVKKYNRYSDYTSYGHDLRHLAWEVRDLFKHPDVDKEKFVNRLSIKKYIAVTEKVFDKDMVEIKSETTSFYFRYLETSYEFSAPLMLEGTQGDRSEAEKGVFWEIFGRYSALGKGWRRTIQSLLIICWCIVLVVLFEYIWSGLNLCFQWAVRLSDSIVLPLDYLRNLFKL